MVELETWNLSSKLSEKKTIIYIYKHKEILQICFCEDFSWRKF